MVVLASQPGEHNGCEDLIGWSIHKLAELALTVVPRGVALHVCVEHHGDHCCSQLTLLVEVLLSVEGSAEFSP